jgi:4'-phosphopantetheinyl transferase
MPDKPVLAQWILDTRDWYPGATQTKQLEIHVSLFA